MTFSEFLFIVLLYVAHLVTAQNTGVTSLGTVHRFSRFDPTQGIYPSLSDPEFLLRNSSFVTPTMNLALKMGTVVLQSVQVSLPFTSSTPSIVVSTSTPHVSSFPSSTPLVIVPSPDPLIISNSSSVSSSSSMAGQVMRFTFNAYGPLDIAAIPGQTHALPTSNYIKQLPKFHGNYVIDA
jgi:hypothetical protein